MQHLRKALTKCKYAKWALDKEERRFISNNQEESHMSNNQGEKSDDVNNNPSSNSEGRDTTKDKCNRGHIYRGTWRETHFKENRTIKNILVKPKDKDLLDWKSGTIYWYQWGELTCDEEYIGEISRTFGERYKEHLRNPHPSMDMTTFQDIAPNLITSPS